MSRGPDVSLPPKASATPCCAPAWSVKIGSPGLPRPLPSFFDPFFPARLVGSRMGVTSGTSSPAAASCPVAVPAALPLLQRVPATIGTS